MNSWNSKATRIKDIPNWVFLLLFAFFAAISISALRQNNQHMIQLRDALYQADKQDGDVNAALNHLRSYVYGHMNTDLSSGGNSIKPPIQLKYTYERLVTEEQKRVDKINSKIYTQAQIYCQAQNPIGFSGGVRVPCVREYVSTHGTKPKEVPPALYQFDFVSPSWSPDLAGWSILLSAIFLVVFLFRYFAGKASFIKPNK